jgi:hypothetical protein
MRKFAVCTTFNEKGYKKYGQRMIKSFLATWPKEVTLYVYAENCTVEETADNLIVKNCERDLSDLVAFKERWKDTPKANGDVSNDPRRSQRKDSGKGFKWDAVRFAHKVYAIFDCAKNCNTDVLLWMDADMVCHTEIHIDTIDRFCPPEQELCFLGRKRKFSECGLYSMNLTSPMTRTFLNEFQRMYDQAESGIFQLEEWHDSFVFDAVRVKFPSLKSLNWSDGLITGEGHPLINTPWGAYLDHLKGARKDAGRSHQRDLLTPRTEPYWSVQ